MGGPHREVYTSVIRGSSLRSLAEFIVECICCASDQRAGGFAMPAAAAV